MSVRTAFILTALLSILFFTSSCGGDASLAISYTPPFAPITFTIDSTGHISVSTSASIVTAFGTFAVGVEISSSLKSRNNELYVIIRHKQNGSVVDTVYKIQTDQDGITVTVDGKTTIQITNRKVFIDASQGTIASIVVRGPNSNNTRDVSATASVAAANPYPSYLPGSGTLALYDTLDGSSNNYSWDTGGGCTFSESGYHISESDEGNFHTCTARSSDFANFAFEVELTFLRGSRDCAGAIFRVDHNQDKFYYFSICEDGYYGLLAYVDDLGSDAKTLIDYTQSSAISTGLSIANVIDVLADGNALSFYVNSRKIASIRDNTYTQGQIGLFADAQNDATEVVFNNAKVWTLCGCTYFSEQLTLQNRQ